MTGQTGNPRYFAADALAAYLARVAEPESRTRTPFARDRDRIIPVAHARVAHEAIPGSRLEIFDRVGHLPQLEAPGRFVVGDEGGVKVPAGTYGGSIHTGDLDMWSFCANAAEVEVVLTPLGGLGRHLGDRVSSGIRMDRPSDREGRPRRRDGR